MPYPGWHRAENVVSWLSWQEPVELHLDSQVYLGYVIRHGGIAQFSGTNAERR